MKSVSVVVLGEIGRSPRMRYHSISLANSGHKVNVIGYGQHPKDLIPFKNISVHSMIPFPEIPIPRIIKYFLKALWQCLTLFLALIMAKSTDFVLVQNPPAVPTLFVCWLYCFIFRVKFVIDWHNYAYTIMGLALGNEHKLVVATRFLESYFGGKAHANLCVTCAMKSNLCERWGIQAVTLYDRPPLIFHPISLEEKHEFVKRLGEKYGEFLREEDEEGTVFTSCNEDKKISLKEDRPALLVSSTSWTEDEDFGILLTALQEYEKVYDDGNIRNLPKLICVITGNGPQKEHYLNIIKNHVWKAVTILTAWLETEDYPLMLASADLGVCLHYSSSGLDLPMKVVDMFGAGLPVCAYNFKCLSELVKHKENGLIFKDASELSQQLQGWFENFPKNETQIKDEISYKTELERFQKLRWEENWNKVALPIFK